MQGLTDKTSDISKQSLSIGTLFDFCKKDELEISQELFSLTLFE